jgi:hypothetical protein
VSHTELRHPQLHLLPNDTLTILVAREVLIPDFVSQVRVAYGAAAPPAAPAAQRHADHPSSTRGLNP